MISKIKNIMKNTLPKNYFNTDHLKSNIKTRALKGVGATLIGQALGLAMHILSTIILARLLTPTDFGLLTIVTTFSLLLASVGVNGVTEALIQEDNLNHEVVNTLFWLNISIGVLLTISFMLVSPFLAHIYNDPRLEKVATFVSLSILANSLATIHSALLKRNMQFYFTSIIALSSRGLGLLVTVILALNDFHYWALVINTILTPLSITVGSWLFCKWRPSAPSFSGDVKEIILFSVNTYSRFIMNYFSRNIDNFIVGYKFGSQSLGYYKKAYDLFALPVNLLTSRLTDVAIATLSRYKNDPKIFLKYYLESISILSFVGMGISLVATINSKDIILLILGAQWSIAGEIFTYFSPGIGVMLVYGTNGWLHLSLGRADRWLKWGVIELSVTVLLFLIGTNWGPSGIAVAWTTSFYVLLFPGLLFAGRPVNLKLLVIVDGIWRYLLSALISGVICWYCLYEVEFISVVFHHLNLVGRILTSCIFSLSIYLTMIIIFHRNIDPIIRLLSIARQMIPGNRRP